MQTKLTRISCLLIVGMMTFFNVTYAGIIIVDTQTGSSGGHEEIAVLTSSSLCNFEFSTGMYLANLVDNGEELVLPNDMEDIYLKIEFDGYIDIVKVEPSGSYSIEYTIPNEPNLIPSEEQLYWWPYNFTADLSDACTEATKDVVMITSIVTENGDPYPMLDFGTEMEVFSCSFFRGTCHLCDNQSEQCASAQYSPLEYNQDSQTFRLDCCMCKDVSCFGSLNDERNISGRLILPYQSTSPEMESVQNELAANEDDFEESTLSPNPVNDYFYLKSQRPGERVIYIEIYNANGSLVVREKNQSNNGAFYEELDSSNFAPGVYYVKILSQKKTELISFVKLK